MGYTKVWVRCAWFENGLGCGLSCWRSWPCVEEDVLVVDGTTSGTEMEHVGPIQDVD